MIREAIGKHAAAVFAFRYGVQDGGNVDADPRGEFPKQNVLSLSHSIDETATKFGKSGPEIERLLGDAKAKLLETRAVVRARCGMTRRWSLGTG